MSIFNILRLSEVLAQKGEERTIAFLKTHFRCERNVDIEDFLFRNAVRFELARLALLWEMSLSFLPISHCHLNL